MVGVLIAGGFCLFTWNMVQMVNNMRLDNQGAPTSAVYAPEDELDHYLTEQEETPKETKEPEELPAAEEEEPVYRNESEAVKALRKERDEALNEVEFMKRQLKIMEDMLDSSLSREEELKRAQ